MRTLLSLALMLPALAFAAPTDAEWQQAFGERRELTFTDGSKLVGTIVDLDGDQVRIREDDGSLTTIPATVVDTLAQPPGTRTAPRTAPPPPAPEPVRAPRPGPAVGVNVGMGAGPVSVGVGRTLGNPEVMGSRPSAGREWDLAGVRYPLRGRETIDWIFLTDDGRYRGMPDEIDRPKALRQYVFVDQWGRSIPWQSAWAAMGAEREYIAEVKRIDNTMIPLRATETVLGLGGIGLMIFTYVDSVNKAQNPYSQPGWIAGSAMVIGNIAFSIGVTGPTRNRMRVKLGQQGLQRAEDYFRRQ